MMMKNINLYFEETGVLKVQQRLRSPTKYDKVNQTLGSSNITFTR